ncbi:MarR family winged helix-turn-helix transcriptional regulator [Sphingomonas astaxanthinifaciens]|nr:MarR family winged helix-turn-helix transcriptional regulator [Sphingomonas astaxanthinifaciens]
MTNDTKSPSTSDPTNEFADVNKSTPFIGRPQSGKTQARSSADTDPYLEAAKLIRRVRSLRVDAMPPHLFGEASWDILLSLYIAHREQYRLTIMSVCNEAGVPLTTALRWLQQLVDEGLAIRRSNPLDRRTVHVELSADAIATMDQLMENVLKYNTSL